MPRQRPQIGNTLAELAPTYKLHERRLYDHARDGRLLDLSYRDGWLFEHGEGAPGFQGPVPDKPTEYLLPPGTRAVSIEILSGLVSGRIYQGPLNETAKKKTTVQLYASMSGVAVSLVTDPAVNQPETKFTVYEYRG